MFSIKHYHWLGIFAEKLHVETNRFCISLAELEKHITKMSINNRSQYKFWKRRNRSGRQFYKTFSLFDGCTNRSVALNLESHPSFLADIMLNLISSPLAVCNTKSIRKLFKFFLS